MRTACQMTIIAPPTTACPDGCRACPAQASNPSAGGGSDTSAPQNLMATHSSLFPPGGPLPRGRDAFTLIEVMIAMAIFFVAVFALLDLVTQNVRAARNLKPDSVDASSLAAELMLTNKLTEGSESGDFGNMYPGYSWSREINLVSTNGMFQVDFSVSGPSGQRKMSILLYRPESQTRVGAGSGAGFQMRGGGQ
jgi:prepilin-type N-terminal cleavage/methylation domain-containing protein